MRSYGAQRSTSLYSDYANDSLTNGAAVRLTGTLTDSLGAGQAKELQVQAVDVVGECNPEVSQVVLASSL